MVSEVTIAKAYIQKSQSSADRGIPFELTFSQFKKLYQAKVCYFTGVRLLPKERTIDRLDNSKGYTKDNSFACCLAFNQLKSVVENPNNNLTMNQVSVGFSRVLEKLNDRP